MIQVRRSEERGRTRRDWLNSYHTFSFGEYQDPRYDHFGPLRVLNDDLVGPGGGFPTHPHRDMEIITYVLSGAIEHRDSEGNHGVIRPFEIQRMRAGSGIRHSEANPSPTEPVRLLQIWLFPEREGLPPGYAQKAFDPSARRGRFFTAITPDGRDDTVEIAQDATMRVAHLEPGETASHVLSAGRGAFLHVATGEVEIDGIPLKEGDAAQIVDEQEVVVRAEQPSELVLFDLPV